jgi:casein kinase I family protein HRR25
MIINNKYRIIEQIGTGSFGLIFKGENIRTKEAVAIKVEPIQNETKLLKNETIIYQYLQNKTGMPKVKWFGKDETNYYMVINLLGESLQILKDRKEIFSLTLTLQIGIQIIHLLQTIHEMGLVHRDIKPDNFLLGLEEKKNQIYIIDFGFCKTFLNGEKHIEMKKTSNIIGSLTYASINTHKFMEQSRRDDLESLGYMLVCFFMGKLPWHELNKNNLILEMKEKMTHSKNISSVFLDYFTYVKKLEFEERPDYLFLIDMFKREISLK